MSKPVAVALNWSCIPWRPHDGETWTRDLLPRLEQKGFSREQLQRSVYVIRLNGNFTIQYPKGDSPAIYIGEGTFSQRIASHSKWARKLGHLVEDWSFQICVAAPRVKRQPNTYLDCEAALLLRFGERFGSAPLHNLQFERRRFQHHVYSERKMDYVLGKRSGSTYHWAIKPLKSSDFYDAYHRTHRGAG